VYPVIRTLSEWDPEHPDNGAPGPDDDPWGGSLLVGTIMPDGTEAWHTVPGRIDLDELDDDVRIEFDIGGRLLARQGTRVEALPDGDGRMVVTPLPIGFDAVDHMIRIEGETRIRIAHDHVRLGHHKRAITR
jgi:hypothetical protein